MGYQSLQTFWVRAPLLSVLEYERLMMSEDLLAELRILAKNPVVREAVGVVSLSLLEALPHLDAEEPSRKRDQTIKAFLRYLIRMTTRSTPYGLCAGVVSGSFDDRAELVLAARKHYKKRTRPDMEWMHKVVVRIEQRVEVMKNLHVFINPLCYTVGTRMKLAFAHRMPEVEATSVRLSPAVQQTFQFANEPILFKDLLQKLLGEFPDATEESVLPFLWQLFEQEFLISELRPALLDRQPLSDLLLCIEGIDEVQDVVQSLREIAQGIERYDALPVGEGESTFQEIVQQMGRLAEVKDPLQVDLALVAESLILPKEVGEEVAKIAEVRARLALETTGPAHLSEYRIAFLERYGMGREVPLLELLDGDIGLGAPARYHVPASRRTFTPQVTPFLIRREAVLSTWVQEAIRSGSRELEVTEEMLEKILPENDLRKHPVSMELYYKVVASSPEALESGDYLLVPSGNAGSGRAGRSLGRFRDLWSQETVEALQQVSKAEQEQYAGAILAELTYLPTEARLGNLVMTTTFSPYEITLGTRSSKPKRQTLPLSDLLVGCTLDRLYIRSRSLGRQVILTTSHMLNTNMAPNLYRFLREVGDESVAAWSGFQWGALDRFAFLPRLRMGKVVLTPARWRISKELTPFRSRLDEQSFKQAIQMWRQEWKVPRYVLLTNADHRLLLDLEHPMHLEELRRGVEKLQGSDSVLLVEAEWESEAGLLSSPDGAFILEGVFPIVRREVGLSQPIPGNYHPQRERVFWPGGKWLYLKLYGMTTREQEFIGAYLRPFCEQVQQEEVAESYFYMRYEDPEPHIRLRFHGEPSVVWGTLVTRLHEWTKELQREGLLSKMVIDTYVSEVERYGGEGLIELAEHVFAVDSQVSAKWIAYDRFGEWNLRLEMVAMISVLDLLENFGLPLPEQLAWLNRMIADYQLYRGEFRRDRVQYLKWVDPTDDWAGIRAHPDGMLVWNALEERRAVVRAYADEILHGEANGDLTNERMSIVASVVHMHLNRLFGTDREVERKVLSLTRHTVHTLMGMKVNRHETVPQ